MKLFKRTESYTIVADEVSNATVQRIADEFGIKNKEILVRYCDGLFLVTFWTKSERKKLLERLDEKCRLIYDVFASNNLIFVTTKKGSAL